MGDLELEPVTKSYFVGRWVPFRVQKLITIHKGKGRRKRLPLFMITALNAGFLLYSKRDGKYNYLLRLRQIGGLMENLSLVIQDKPGGLAHDSAKTTFHKCRAQDAQVGSDAEWACPLEAFAHPSCPSRALHSLFSNHGTHLPNLIQLLHLSFQLMRAP